MGSDVASRCVFCQITAGNEPAAVVRRWTETIAVVPLNPVVAGHIIVIPYAHVDDWATDPVITATTALRAAEICQRMGLKASNMISSAGAEATQSVFHLHIHVIPRQEGDGLMLPWQKPGLTHETKVPHGQ